MRWLWRANEGPGRDRLRAVLTLESARCRLKVGWGRASLCAALPICTFLVTLFPLQAAAGETSPPLISSLQMLAGANQEATGVSCPPHGSCVAVDYSGNVYLLSGKRGIKVGALDYRLSGVSCPTVNFCAADSYNDSGVVVILPTHTYFYALYDSTLQPDTQWQSMSCASQIFCMAGGGIVTGPDKGAGVVSRWNGLSWSPAQVIDPKVAAPDIQITTMTCPSPKFCVAADQYQHTLQWNGRAWFFPAALNQPRIDDSFTVSCISSKYCMALSSDTASTVIWNGQKWQDQPTSPNFTYGAYATVSCATRTYCVALDAVGNASFWNGRYWSDLQVIDPKPHDQVPELSCSSESFCEALTEDDHYVYLYDRNEKPKLPFLCSEFACEGERI